MKNRLTVLILWHAALLSGNPDEPPAWLVGLAEDQPMAVRKGLYDRARAAGLAAPADATVCGATEFPTFYRCLWRRALGRPLPFWATTDHLDNDPAFGWRIIHPEARP